MYYSQFSRWLSPLTLWHDLATAWLTSEWPQSVIPSFGNFYSVGSMLPQCVGWAPLLHFRYSFFLGCEYLFIHSIGMCRMRQFLAVLRSFFHFPLLCMFSCHRSPPISLPSPLTSSCHLFLGLPLSLVASKFIYNTLLGILFPSILCTCSNQHNLFNLIVSIIVGFF